MKSKMVISFHIISIAMLVGSWANLSVVNVRLLDIVLETVSLFIGKCTSEVVLSMLVKSDHQKLRHVLL